MAKYTNVVRIIKKEIEKGNIYMTEKGNFVSAEYVNSNVKEQFLKDLKSEKIPFTTSFDEYAKDKTEKVVSATEVLSKIIVDFGIKTESEETTEEEKPVTKEEPKKEHKTTSKTGGGRK